jgi:hypothetical protein
MTVISMPSAATINDTMQKMFNWASGEQVQTTPTVTPYNRTERRRVMEHERVLQ